MGSEWYTLTALQDKDAPGKGLAEVLVEIAKDFENYDLDSPEGLEEACEDIRCRLAEVAETTVTESRESLISSVGTSEGDEVSIHNEDGDSVPQEADQREQKDLLDTVHR
ncbi:unnamed protein product [Cyclocybe aegerita]|uniref:Uncharacterized protein n=1 Tax=Cyclocybe aegerita TaxID=1973307 RepID=A0A8S0VZA5_CYCAE|nr:unnamed protein product [Cyclocybe aegerita]